MLHTLAADGSGVYVDEAEEALAQNNVYVSDEVQGADALRQTLEQQVTDESIAVAVFSDNAALEATGGDIVTELAGLPGYQTIIVAVGDDLSAGSRVLETGEALRIANEAEDSADSLEDAILQTVDGVVAATPAEASQGGGVDGGLVVGGVLGLVVLVAAGGALWAVLRRRRHGTSGHHAPLPDTVRPLVGRLRALSGEYAAAGASGNRDATEVAGEIVTVANNTTELFDRLDRKGDEGQRATAAVEYGETLRKLTAALDRDYLLDILQHPDLWDDPVDRVREVRTALTSFSTELLENIKQVNARRGLHFQVSLDGLIGRRKELQEWDRAFERADGDTGPAARDD
ncbi:hypothetical protein JNB63_08330 [Microbacterium trichothecenolyticum]|uniref:hypothetical protein n=1 Tax=Microbacterium trichothecenolyticum TaxID=69370 RepID=UPI001C6EB1B8|nr:hypothetical protein [Microbacterium trichothecenolyticum]MBW9120097.1 hypothetical protein [Microbacterium trichothecenolyticum]